MDYLLDSLKDFRIHIPQQIHILFLFITYQHIITYFFNSMDLHTVYPGRGILFTSTP